MFRSTAIILKLPRIPSILSKKPLSTAIANRSIILSNFIRDRQKNGKLPDQHIRVYSHKAPLTIKLLEERIILVLSLYDKIDPKKLNLDSNFLNDLGLDSLDHVEIIMALEDEFGFEIPDGYADKMKKPRDILQFICDKEDVYH